MKWQRPRTGLIAVGLGVVIASGLMARRAKADRLNHLHNQLVAKDVQKAKKAAKQLGRMRSQKALKVLMETLLLGAPPELSRTLIKAIGKHEKPTSFELLAHYTKNRNDTVRAAALQALMKIENHKQNKRLFSLALRALGDAASQVRATGAKMLVKLKARGLSEKLLARAEEHLIKLLVVRRDQLTAKIGLSALGGVRTARMLAINVNDGLGERIVTTIFGAFLKRSDFGPEPVRVWVVKTLERLTGPEAIAVLMDYVASAGGKRKSASVALARKIAER
jgi:HEAT repeat protein